MMQPIDKRQREQDVLAYFLKHPINSVTELECKIAAASDIPALLHLERYCFNPYLAFGRRRWKYLIDTSSCSTILIFEKEILVAYLCLLPHRGWQGLEIRALAVHWSYRQKGVGRWLMHLSQALARQWHLRALYLSVDCENDAAKHLYSQMGMHISAKLADYYGLDRHGLRMRCNLDDTSAQI